MARFTLTNLQSMQAVVVRIIEVPAYAHNVVAIVPDGLVGTGILRTCN